MQNERKVEMTDEERLAGFAEVIRRRTIAYETKLYEQFKQDGNPLYIYFKQKDPA